MIVVIRYSASPILSCPQPCTLVHLHLLYNRQTIPGQSVLLMSVVMGMYVVGRIRNRLRTNSKHV